MTKKRNNKPKGLKLPSVSKMSGRASTIVGGICNAIMPSIEPTDDEINKVLKIFDQENGELKCVYCGDKATEWDHFYSITKEKKPSGYITEINNLVPSCGSCNQSRGNKEPIGWMRSSAPKSPSSRGVENINDKIEKIEKYKEELDRYKVNDSLYEETDEWKKLVSIKEKIIELLKEADENIILLRKKLTIEYENEKYNQTKS